MIYKLCSHVKAVQYSSIYLTADFHGWCQFTGLVRLQWLISAKKTDDVNIQRTVFERWPETDDSMCLDCFPGHEANDVLWQFHIKLSLVNGMCVLNQLLINESGMSGEVKLRNYRLLPKVTDCHSFSIHVCMEIWFTSLYKFFPTQFIHQKNEYHKPNNFIWNSWRSFYHKYESKWLLKYAEWNTAHCFKGNKFTNTCGYNCAIAHFMVLLYLQLRHITFLQLWQAQEWLCVI